MSVYRKDRYGNLRKIAGSLTQRLNTAILKAAHTIENGVDYYTINEAEAASYISSLTDNTNFWIYVDEANVSNTVYLRYKNQTLKVVQNNSENIPAESLYGKLELFTLNASETNTINLTIASGAGEIITLGLDGIIENQQVIFDLQNASSYMSYLTNQHNFLVTAILPVVGEIDLTYPVKIKVNDTLYNIYSYTKTADEPLMIGDLMSNSAYNTEIGYRFVANMLFVETTDVTGFILEPSNIQADQLLNIIEDSDTIITSLDDSGTKVKINLAASIVNKLAKVLVTPSSAQTATELVAVGSDQMQEMLKIGSGLYIADGELKATGGETGGTTNYQDLDNKPILNTSNTTSQTPNANETINGTINLHKVSKTGNFGDLNGTENVVLSAQLENLLPKSIIMGE